MSDAPTPPPGFIHDLAERAVDFVRRTHGIALDYQPETLPLLEHYLTSVPRAQAPVVELVAAAAGAYFGEVLRRILGGAWHGDDHAAELVLGPGIRLSPAGMAGEAIHGGEAEGYDGSFEVPVAERAEVEAALAEREVPESEYYTLGSRLETLLYVADLITGRRLDPLPPDPDPEAPQ